MGYLTFGVQYRLRIQKLFEIHDSHLKVYNNELYFTGFVSDWTNCADWIFCKVPTVGFDILLIFESLCFESL
jgi:hypothetical protein